MNMRGKAVIGENAFTVPVVLGVNREGASFVWKAGCNWQATKEPPEIASAAMLTNANELKGVAFTFIIDLAVCKSTSDLGRAVCFFVLCEINIR